jgi:hypothetical protein
VCVPDEREIGAGAAFCAARSDGERLDALRRRLRRTGEHSSPAWSVTRWKPARRQRAALDLERQATGRARGNGDRFMFAIERATHDAVDAQQRTGLRFVPKRRSVRSAAKRPVRAQGHDRAVVADRDEPVLHGSANAAAIASGASRGTK